MAAAPSGRPPDVSRVLSGSRERESGWTSLGRSPGDWALIGSPNSASSTTSRRMSASYAEGEYPILDKSNTPVENRARRALRARRRGFMKRWLPIVGGISLNLALGSLYAWSVFVLPLEKEFGWTRAQTAWVYTIAVVTFASTFVLAGRIQDRRGPRPCALAGAVLVSLGFFAASFTGSLWFLYLAFGLVVGAGNGFGYATPMPVASKWFPDRRGLVVGLMVGGYGAGSAIIGPIATNVIASAGWRPTFRLLGVVFLLMGLARAWL